MRPFLNLEDATPLTFNSVPQAAEYETLRAGWNQTTAKLQACLQQGSRLENLFWRRWHMERRVERGGYSNAPSPLDQHHVESAREMDVLSSLLGLGAEQAHAQQPAPQPPVLHAPQPQHPQPPIDFSAHWDATSQPPPGTNRIIATPSWTAMFNDTQNAAAAGMSQPPLLNPLYQSAFSPPAAPLPVNPNSAANSVPSYPFSSGPTNAFSSVSSAHFALPPTTTLFTDHIQALSASAAPSAFYSSYGLYQPVQGPYARFLTPSPEPSVLGDFELEIELENMAAANAAAGNGWNDAEGKQGEEGGGTRDPFAGMTIAPSRPTSPKLEQDAFESSNQQSNSAFDLFTQAQQQQQHGQYESYGDGSFGGGVGGDAGPSFGGGGDATEPNEWEARNGDSDTESKDAKTNIKGKGKAKIKAPRKPRPKKAAGAAAMATGADGAAAGAGGAAAAEKANSKKNRNPHATQLPGGGGKKKEAGDGHEGPICTHCGSVTTPLWRRGPADELLCNACGLYQKLHSKPRPKAFATQANSAKRSQNGAAAQAAASGVPPSCHNCSATSTPMWRKDAQGNLCCNACSLYYKLHQVVRPAALSQKRKAAAAAAAAAAAVAASQPNSAGSTPAANPPAPALTRASSSSTEAAAPSGMTAPFLPPPNTNSGTSTPVIGLPRPLSPKPPTLPSTLTHQLLNPHVVNGHGNASGQNSPHQQSPHQWHSPLLHAPPVLPPLASPNFQQHRPPLPSPSFQQHQQRLQTHSPAGTTSWALPPPLDNSLGLGLGSQGNGEPMAKRARVGVDESWERGTPPPVVAGGAGGWNGAGYGFPSRG